MKEQFVPYELALKLKELGFDEECLGAYNQSDNNKFMIAPQLSSYEINTGKNSDRTDINVVTAPLWQQAFDWFRERHNHSGEVYFYSSADFGKWHFDIEPLKLDGERFTTPVKEGFQTYSLARESCIEKLIEIIENSKKS